MEFAGDRPIRRITLAVALVGLVATGWRLLPMPVAGAVAPNFASEPALVVEVRNASPRPGVARLVTRLLREKGVDVIYFGTSSTALDSTTILVRRGPLARGHQVAKLLGGALVKSAPDTLLRIDLTVLIGADYRLPKERFPL